MCVWMHFEGEWSACVGPVGRLDYERGRRREPLSLGHRATGSWGDRSNFAINRCSSAWTLTTLPVAATLDWSEDLYLMFGPCGAMRMKSFLSYAWTIAFEGCRVFFSFSALMMKIFDLSRTSLKLFLWPSSIDRLFLERIVWSWWGNFDQMIIFICRKF